MNFYELLGITEDAGPLEIKKAYRRMAEVYHPDKLNFLPASVREEGRDIMRALNEAKGTLLDPEMRGQYDQLLKSGKRTVPVDEMEYIKPEVVRARVKGESLFSKMSRVLGIMKETYSLDHEFTAKIVQAQEIVETNVIEETEEKVGDRRSGRVEDDEEDLEMTLRFSVLKKSRNKEPRKRRKGFKIVAIEGCDEAAVDAEWGEVEGQYAEEVEEGEWVEDVKDDGKQPAMSRVRIDDDTEE